MPPRRSHKKSKAGCQRCKSRKIKCDEAHPKCGNCSKHGVTCDFVASGSIASISAPSPNAHSLIESTSNYSVSSPGSNTMIIARTPLDIVRSNANPAASRSLELKLMHHYTALTSGTFSDNKDQTVAWQVDIPTIAYDAQYLMDAILAVSALHLRALNPEDHSMVRASHGYMASALSQYSSLLRNGVSEFNAEALFSTAALIAFQSSASRRFDDSDGTYNLPLAWFHSFQGVKTVVMESWQWLRNSARVFSIISAQPALNLNLDDRATFFAPLLDGLEEQVASEPEETRPEMMRSYEHAVAYLNFAHQRPDRGRILGFAAIVSRRFVELIAQHEPRALVIIACFFAMTKTVDDVWWLQGVAKREVRGLCSLLPQQWWGKMDWPIQIANHNGPMTDHLWGVSRSTEIKKEDNIRGHIDILADIMNQSAPPMPPD